MSKSWLEEKDTANESQEQTPSEIDAQSPAEGDHVVAVTTESDAPPDGGYGWFVLRLVKSE